MPLQVLLARLIFVKGLANVGYVQTRLFGQEDIRHQRRPTALCRFYRVVARPFDDGVGTCLAQPVRLSVLGLHAQRLLPRSAGISFSFAFHRADGQLPAMGLDAATSIWPDRPA